MDSQLTIHNLILNSLEWMSLDVVNANKTQNNRIVLRKRHTNKLSELMKFKLLIAPNKALDEFT